MAREVIKDKTNSRSSSRSKSRSKKDLKDIKLTNVKNNNSNNNSSSNEKPFKPLVSTMNIFTKTIRCIIAAVYYVFIAIFIYPFLFFSNVLIAPFSNDLSIRINNIVNLFIYFNMVITTETWNNVEMIYTGDKIPEKENACLFMNHITSPDPLYLFPLGLRARRLGAFKFFTKSEAKMYFPFGTGMWLSGNIFVDRNWTVDNDKIEAAFRHFNNSPNAPLWIMIFLEGRRFTEERHNEAVKFAEKNNLSIPEHTLMPRTKGFVSTLKGAGNLLNAVYDITISYSPEEPSVYYNHLLNFNFRCLSGQLEVFVIKFIYILNVILLSIFMANQTRNYQNFAMIHGKTKIN